jgi:hypothetical protein
MDCNVSLKEGDCKYGRVVVECQSARCACWFVPVVSNAQDLEVSKGLG